MRALGRAVGGRAQGERGSGSVLALALIGATVALALAVLAMAAALGVRQRVIGAADAAALAAADGASGAIAGAPCTLAARVAGAVGARVDECRLDGLIATVEVSGSFGGVPFVARSTAGPPP